MKGVLKMRRKNMLSVLLLVFLLVISGCSKNDTQSTDTEKENADVKENVEVDKGKHLNAATYWIGSDADPGKDWNAWGLQRAAAIECLVTLDENLQLVPQLATEWQMEDDLTWRFHIREGVKFSDGKDLTPEDVKWSIERAIGQDSRAKTQAMLDSITIDGQDIVYKTTEPYYSLVYNLTEPLFGIISKDQDEENIAKTPVTTAPYTITNYVMDDRIELARNEYYWDGEVPFAIVTLKQITDENTMMMALQSGEIDIYQGKSILDEFENKDKYQIAFKPSLRELYLVANHKNEFLKDKDIRAAISYALDREKLAKVSGVGFTVSGAPFTPSVDYGYDELPVQSFDPEKAKELLEGAGFSLNGDGYYERDGKVLEFDILEDAKNFPFQAIQAQLKEIGIKINLPQRENSLDAAKSGDFDLFAKNYVTLMTGDPKHYLEENFGTEGTDNFGKYSNPALDECVEKLNKTYKPEERRAITIDAQKIILDDVADIFLLSDQGFVVAKAGLKNVNYYPIDYYFLTKDIDFE